MDHRALLDGIEQLAAFRDDQPRLADISRDILAPTGTA